MKRFVLAVTGALVLVACSQQSEAAPQTPAPAVPHVVFYAEGDGTKAASMTLRSESGGVIQKDIALPLTDTSTGQAGIASGQFKRGGDLYISLQNKEASGSVTCRIKVDGETIDEATSTGNRVVVTCVGKVP